MASIVQRNKSFSVVYTTYTECGKKQKWETYHSYEAALHRKEQIKLIQAKQKERLQSNADNLAELLEEYVELYGRAHWSYSTYTNYVSLIKNHILPFLGEMRLTEFSPKIIATLYSRMRYQQNLTPQMLTSIHKLLHSAFEQAVLWEYADRNPFHKSCTSKIIFLSNGNVVQRRNQALIAKQRIFSTWDCSSSCLCRLSAKR